MSTYLKSAKQSEFQTEKQNLFRATWPGVQMENMYQNDIGIFDDSFNFENKNIR